VPDPTTSTPRTRVRWGWIIGCIVLGLAGIGAGLLVVPPTDRAAYAASVLAGVGTTLLLVGFVVLLERRIIDTTARAVQRAVDAERQASDARIDRLVGEFEDRMSAEWARVDPADAEATRRRSAELTHEMVDQVVDEATGSATKSRPSGQ
jgi:membrane protein implicated in regulation of membrane protease activity